MFTGVKLTVSGDGLALEESETVRALEAGDLAVREDGGELGLLGVSLHSVGLDDLELKTIVLGSSESLFEQKATVVSNQPLTAATQGRMLNLAWNLRG